MNARTFRVTGLSLAAAFGAGWIGLVRAPVVGLAAVLVLVALGALALWTRERRRVALLEDSLRRETARAREVSDYAWQSALLGQVVDELRGSSDVMATLETATTALGRALKASRSVLYGLDPDGRFRVRSQFVAEGGVPLEPEASLPSVLAADGELRRRIAAGDITAEEDPDVRALGERLSVRALVVMPVAQGHVLTVDQCDTPRSWSRAEIRFVQRVAEQLGAALEQAAAFRQQSHALEVRCGLLRVAQALYAARDSGAVLDLATSAGAPLTGCRASAVFVERDGRFELASQFGFEGELSEARVVALQSELENAVRARGPLFVNHRQSSVRRAEMRNFGPLAVVPIFYGRELEGVFLLERRESQGIWEGADVEVAQVAAELTASALKNAELFETLSSSEARYEDLYDHAPDLYHTIDPSGRILDCNLTECLTLGYAKDELVGTRFEALLQKSSIADWARFEAELFEKGHLRDAALELRTREGRVVEVHVNASVIVAPRGEALSARVVMRDVTEVRSLEHQLLQSQKLEVVGALAGGIAHDFNNVLGGILGYASLLRAHLGDRPLAKRYVETIERSAVRAAELTERLLAASRKSPARKVAVNVNRVVEETLELLARTFHKKIRIVKRLDAGIGPVVADRGQLQQVVLNLCVNARDAMPEGGYLEVATEVDRRGERLRLIVEDSGVGMEPGTIQRLFEPFFSTKGEGGTGLGLSVVYGIVKSLGGDVRVKSAPGKGARFDIFLPMQPSAERTEVVTEVEPVCGHGELILLADDESVLRELGKEILEAYGYRVETVPTGEAALAFVRDSGERVALVILDVVMPGLDGNETCRRLRHLDAGVPVLLSSGLTAEEAMKHSVTEDSAGFIPKPYGIGELTRAVSTALRGTDPSLMH